jgi:cytochrome b subunit of formate dehydrogenase
VAYTISPLYRGLTVQFKTYVKTSSTHPTCGYYVSLLIHLSYIQMSGMILGGYLEAEKRMWAYQHHIRHQRRIARDTEIWRRYEADYEEKGTPGVGAESNVHRKGPGA